MADEGYSTTKKVGLSWRIRPLRRVAEFAHARRHVDRRPSRGAPSHFSWPHGG